MDLGLATVAAGDITLSSWGFMLEIADFFTSLGAPYWGTIAAL